MLIKVVNYCGYKDLNPNNLYPLLFNIVHNPHLFINDLSMKCIFHNKNANRTLESNTLCIDTFFLIKLIDNQPLKS